MKSYSALISIGVLAAAASTGALAQSKTTTEQPKAIGVSQETANEAQSKAMKKGDVATVVRTGPTAGDKAKEVASDTKNKAGDMASDTKDGAKAATNKTKAKVNAATDSTTTTSTTTKP